MSDREPYDWTQAAADRLSDEELAAKLWTEAPIPLGGEVPPFPVDCLPEWLAEYVTSVAVSSQTPPDLAGMLVLAVLATAAGGRAEVEPRPGWREPCNLYIAVALPPGNRKSAVFAAVSRPLYAAERAAIADARPGILEAEGKRRVADEATRKAEADAVHAKADKRNEKIEEALEAGKQADKIRVPPYPRLLADDITPEALASLLVDHGRMAVFSAEGGVFGLMRGRYSRMPNLEVFLKGHPGDELRVDRQGRAPQIVAHPALTIGVTVQPGVLHDAGEEAVFRYRGLLARFLYSLPESNVGQREVDTVPVPTGVEDRYSSNVRALVGSLEDWGSNPSILRFDSGARAALIEFERWLEPKLGTFGAYGEVVSWAAKLAGAVARIAGLLHLARHLATGWGEPVTERDVDDAIVFGHYLAAHALVTFDVMGADQTKADARAVLAWLRRQGRPSFSRKDCYRALHSRFVIAEEVDPVLELLVDHHWIMPKEMVHGGLGRPPSPQYEVHRSLLDPYLIWQKHVPYVSEVGPEPRSGTSVTDSCQIGESPQSSDTSVTGFRQNGPQTSGTSVTDSVQDEPPW